MNWLYLQRQLALGMGRCVVVFDQGFLQNLWSVYLWASGSSPGDGMASLVGTDAADLVVVVSAPDEVIEARLAVRRGKQSRRERLNVAASKDLADRGKGLQEEVIEAALSASIPARKIIHVTNDRAESPSKAVLPILAEIRAMQDWRGI